MQGFKGKGNVLRGCLVLVPDLMSGMRAKCVNN